MDLSDVGYDAFLINGKQSLHNTDIKPGERVRLRIINASASSYFHVEFSGGDMTLIEADGVAVVERAVERLRLATAETYDVVVEIHADKRYEVRATAEDGSGYASYYLGSGDPVFRYPCDKNPIFTWWGMKSHSRRRGKIVHADRHGSMHGTSEYAGLRAKSPTSFDTNRKTREIDLRLTGSMERYTWSFDDKTLTEVDKIRIKKGEVVRFRLINETMMHHPHPFAWPFLPGTEW